MCTPRFFREATMKTQAIILTNLISFLVLGILFLLFYINYMLAKSRFQGSSDIIYQRMNYQIISNYLYYNSLKIENTFNRNGDQLIIMNQLYLRLSEMIDNITINQDINMNFSGIQNIPESMQSNFVYGDCTTSYSFLCYTNLTNWNNMTQQDLKGVKLQQHMQYLGQIIYQNSLTKQQFIYGYTKYDKINFIYPCLSRGQKSYSYFPEEREWYQQALKQYNQGNYTNYKYTLTDPFILFTSQQQGISLTMPLVDKNKSFIGALATNIQSQGLLDSIIPPNESLTMVLVADCEGKLLVHNFPTDELMISINNTRLTGFNDDDWEQMISSDGISNCHNMKNSRILCRFNTLYQQDMHVGITKLKFFNLYLIIIDDTTSFIKFQQQLQENIDKALRRLLFYVFIWGGFILIIVLLLQLLKFILILRPIYLLLHQAKKKYQHRQLVQLTTFQNLMTNDTIRKLIFQYNGLYSKLSSINKNKSLYCKELEDEQQYPQFMQEHLPLEIINSIEFISDGKEFSWYYSSKSSSKFSRNWRLPPQPCIF